MKEYGKRVEQCVIVHEKKHCNETGVNCKREGLNQCDPNANLAGDSEDSLSIHESECEAYKAELDCLDQISNKDPKELERYNQVKNNKEKACTLADQQ